MSTDPMSAIRVLRERVAEKVEEIGLNLVQFSLPNVPPSDHEETVFYGVFIIADEDLYQGHVDDVIDQHNVDQAFAALVDDLNIQTIEDKQQEVKDRMAQRLKEMREGRAEGDVE